MKLGFSTMNGHAGIAPHRLALAAEERGFESLWFGEHPHIPVGSPSPYGGDAPLPDAYLHMMDPFISLTAAAMVTTSLRLGTSVALVLERDPIVLAKECATLDLLSGGRLVLGVGTGWNQREYENHTNVPWSHRYALMRERVGALRTLWTKDQASYCGEYVRFDAVWSYPKPAQPTGPPILLGSAGPTGIKHAVAWADGWFPLVSRFDGFARRLRLLSEEADRAGRDLSTFEVTASVNGSPDVAELARFRELGIARVRLGGSPTESMDEPDVLRRLDLYADLIPDLA